MSPSSVARLLHSLVAHSLSPRKRPLSAPGSSLKRFYARYALFPDSRNLSPILADTESTQAAKFLRACLIVSRLLITTRVGLG